MSKTALLYAVIGLIGWGTAPLFDKLAMTNLSAGAAVILRSGLATIILVGYGGVAGWLPEITAEGIVPVLLLLVGIVASPVIGNFAYLRALKEAEASQVTPIVFSSPLLSVILAALFLGERLTLTKAAGVVLIVVGIVLVSGIGRTA